MMDGVRVTTCPVCGGSQFRAFGEAPWRPPQLHRWQSRCRTCGLVLAQPQASDAAMAAYYDGAFYGTLWADADHLHEETREWHRTRGLPHFQQLWNGWDVHPPGVAVDVGCGYGGLLAALRDAGWTGRGVEPSARAVAHARAQGLDVVQGADPSAFRGANADVAFAWHVLEHVRHPADFLRDLVAAVRPGGVVGIGTDAIWTTQHVLQRAAARLRGRMPPYRTSTDHTFVFTPQLLTRLLLAAGCDDVRVEVYSERPAHESWHWRAYKGFCRTMDRALGWGEFLVAVGRRR
jgi:SAM-dependent methyltransferase